MFGVCRLIDLVVPDIPESLDVKIKRERYLAKEALQDADHVLQVKFFGCLESIERSKQAHTTQSECISSRSQESICIPESSLTASLSLKPSLQRETSSLKRISYVKDYCPSLSLFY